MNTPPVPRTWVTYHSFMMLRGQQVRVLDVSKDRSGFSIPAMDGLSPAEVRAVGAVLVQLHDGAQALMEKP